MLCPHAANAVTEEIMDGVHVRRYRYAPARWETLVNDGGIVVNLTRKPWKWLLVPGFLAGQWWSMRQLLRCWRPDVIHAHWLIPQGAIAALGSRGVRFVVTSHGADLYSLRGRLLNGIKRHVAKSCAAMTVVSSAMCDEAARIGLAPSRIEVLPMGVDLQQRFVPGANQMRSEDELLFVGRLVPKKGLGHLLNALPIVVRQRSTVLLTIVGFGPEEDVLRAQVQRLGMERHVKFAGAMSQHALPELYRRAALFVAPFVRDASGDQEGLPVALMEAIGCGCPVVVGEVAGIGDLLGDIAQAVCVNPEDTQALAAAIVESLQQPSRARAQALSLRRTMVNRIDWQTIAHGYSELLMSCVGDSMKTGQSV